MANNKDLMYLNGGILPCDVCKVPLYYLTHMDKSKKKGRIILFCAQCGLKHFGDVDTLRAYAVTLRQEQRKLRNANG